MEIKTFITDLLYQSELRYLNADPKKRQRRWKNLRAYISKEHPLQRLFEMKPKKFNKFIERNNTTLFELLMYQRGGKNVLRFDSDIHFDYIELQKFHLSPTLVSPKNIIFDGKYGTPSSSFGQILEFNEIGCLSPSLKHSKEINLFLGCSVMMGLSLTNYVAGPRYLKRRNVINDLKLPGFEQCVNVNASIEGADFRVLLQKLERTAHLCEKNAIKIKNLICMTGWHNLIYGECKTSDWENYVERICQLGFPTSFITLTSPVSFFILQVHETVCS